MYLCAYLCTFLINNYIFITILLITISKVTSSIKIDDAPTQKHDGEQKNIKEVDIKTPAQVNHIRAFSFIKSL